VIRRPISFVLDAVQIETMNIPAISKTAVFANRDTERDQLPLLADLPPAVQAPAPKSRILTRHRSPLNSLTGLRFFAASFVILFHTRLSVLLAGKGFHAAANFVGNGYLAVPLFFMLSGYILAYNYCGQIETLNHTFRFWEARFARIWPAYVFSLLCSCFPLSNIPPLPIAVRILCMVQSWDPFHPEYAAFWNFVCWTLSVEAFFYLLFPLLQVGLEKLHPAQAAFSGLCLISIAVLFNTPYHNFATRYPGPWFYIPAPVIHLPEFLTGVIIGNLYLQSRGRIDWPRLLHWKGMSRNSAPTGAPLAAGAGFPFLTLIGLLSSLFVLSAPHGRWEGFVLPSFGLFLFGIAAERSLISRFLSTPILILGGEISYAMYLLRTPMQKWVLAIPSPQLSHIVEAVYLPLGLIPFSLLCFYFIEGPSRRALRRLFATLQGRRS
jgi:peptidoglycan/LPS O-acetylase OafA/YrhL